MPHPYDTADMPKASMHSTPNVSPCRECRYRSLDKDELPCAKCPELAAFQGRTIPVNLTVDRTFERLHEPHTAHVDYTPKNPQKRTSVLAGTICTICKQGEAKCHGYKDLYKKPICNRCFNRLAARHARYNSIYLPSKPGVL